jgi:hypothetical protein
MNRVLEVAFDNLSLLEEGDVFVDKTTGRIAEVDALAIEKAITNALTVAVIEPGHATSVSCVVNRLDNILSTKKLRLKTRCIPKGYIEEIENEVGFLNPAVSITP